MNNALTTDDLSDRKAIRTGAHAGRDGRRSLRASELEDRGARLIGLGLAEAKLGHVELTEAGHVELELRGL